MYKHVSSGMMINEREYSRLSLTERRYYRLFQSGSSYSEPTRRSRDEDDDFFRTNSFSSFNSFDYSSDSSSSSSNDSFSGYGGGDFGGGGGGSDW